MRYRLVYSQNQGGKFSYDDPDTPYVVGGGYYIIAEIVEAKLAEKFTKKISKKYPAEKKYYPEVSIVKEEFEKFLEKFRNRKIQM